MVAEDRLRICVLKGLTGISAMTSDCVSLPYSFLMHSIFNKSSKTRPYVIVRDY